MSYPCSQKCHAKMINCKILFVCPIDKAGIFNPSRSVIFFNYIFSALIIITKDTSVAFVAEANCVLFGKGCGLKGKVCSHNVAT